MKTAYLPIIDLTSPFLMIHVATRSKEDTAFSTFHFTMCTCIRMYIRFILKETVRKYKRTNYLLSELLFRLFHGTIISEHAFKFCSRYIDNSDGLYQTGKA